MKVQVSGLPSDLIRKILKQKRMKQGGTVRKRSPIVLPHWCRLKKRAQYQNYFQFQHYLKVIGIKDIILLHHLKIHRSKDIKYIRIYIINYSSINFLSSLSVVTSYILLLFFIYNKYFMEEMKRVLPNDMGFIQE